MRGHAAVEVEDEVRMIGVLRLAFHGAPEAVRDYIDRRRVPEPHGAAADGEDDGLDADAALLGIRVVRT